MAPSVRAPARDRVQAQLRGPIPFHYAVLYEGVAGTPGEVSRTAVLWLTLSGDAGGIGILDPAGIICVSRLPDTGPVSKEQIDVTYFFLGRLLRARIEGTRAIGRFLYDVGPFCPEEVFDALYLNVMGKPYDRSEGGEG